MLGDREQQALRRIDAALARIEAAAARPVSAQPSADGSAMRTKVTEALRDLDRLIGALEG